jgi:hypothetical protein
MWCLAWLSGLLGWTCLLGLSVGKKEFELLDRSSSRGGGGGGGTIWLYRPAILPPMPRGRSICDRVGIASVDMKRISDDVRFALAGGDGEM